MADWLTDGGDPQRTAWQKNEHILDVSNVKGMKLLWKYKTDNEPREMHALFPPLIVGRVMTAVGPRQVAIVAGISDNIYAIDGRQYVAVQSGFGIDSRAMQARLNRAILGEYPEVPEGGAIWVFALGGK